MCRILKKKDDVGVSSAALLCLIFMLGVVILPSVYCDYSQSIRRVKSLPGGPIDLRQMIAVTQQASQGLPIKPLLDWDRVFRELPQDPKITERVTIYLNKGNDGYVRKEILVPKKEALSDASQYRDIVAKYIITNLYGWLQVYGAKEVLIEANPELFGLVDEGMRNISPKGSWIGPFLEGVYGGFSIKQATPEDIGNLRDVAPMRLVINTDNLTQGSIAAVDLGGTDIKVVFMHNGELVFYKEFNWDPGKITDAAAEGGHQDILKTLINLARLGAKIDELKKSGDSLSITGFEELEAKVEGAVANNRMSLDEIKGIIEEGKRVLGGEDKALAAIDGIGMSTAGAVVNDRIARTKLVKGLPYAGLGGFSEGFAPMKQILEGIFCVPTAVINDGNAGAVWAAVKGGASNVLALAMGTSLAGGYVDTDNAIAIDWLTEMGSVIFDVASDAQGHENTAVPGVMQQYLAQYGVITLAIKREIVKEEDYLKGKDKLNNDDRGEILTDLQQMYAGTKKCTADQKEKIKQIFETVGEYLAIGIAQCYSYFAMDKVVIFGRVAKTATGEVMLQKARETLVKLRENYSWLPANIEIISANEESDSEDINLRFGQAIGAAYYVQSQNTIPE